MSLRLAKSALIIVCSAVLADLTVAAAFCAAAMYLDNKERI